MMLFAFGSNGKGQLGVGNTDDHETPHECIFKHDESQPLGMPVRIASGGNHTLILFDSGRLFSAGSNDAGQAGLKARESDSLDLHTVFTEIIIPARSQKVKLCSATWEASIIVTEDEEVYTFGSGPNGELGIRREQSRVPQKISAFPPPETSIVDLASGVRHTVAILSNGDMYGWGNGRKGQLGASAKDIVHNPRKILGLTFLVKQATCGREFTYAVGDTTESHGQLLGSEKWGLKIDRPPVSGSPSLPRKQLGSSWCGISVLDTAGNIMSWGRNDRGQLAPENLPKPSQIAIGSEHSVALTDFGEVVAWGWGEHGNCGPKTDEDGNVKGKWQVISSPPTISNREVLGVGAGCATSFLWTASM